MAGSIVEFDRVGLRYGTGAEVLRDLEFRLAFPCGVGFEDPDALSLGVGDRKSTRLNSSHQ